MPAADRNEVMEAVRTPASYELVVDQIRRAIQLGQFVAGERLPPEREMAKQLMVSRTTVREAMRVLQGEGMVEIKRGRNGGAQVVQAQITAAEQRRTLRSRRAEIEAIFDYRLVVEPAAARFAATRRNKRQLSAMRRAVQTMDELMAAELDPRAESPLPSLFFAADSEFHHLIALAASNEMLQRAVDEARAGIFAPVGGIFNSLHLTANDLHREIFLGIENEDPGEAGTAMERHIELSREALQRIAHPAKARPGGPRAQTRSK